MAEFVNKMILDASQYKTELTSVTQKTREQKQAIADQKAQFEKIKGSISKVVGIIGSLSAGYATFQKAMNSNYSTMINYQSTMEGLSSTVDDFFSAMARGDWSKFDEGIMSAIRKAKNFKKEMLDAINAIPIQNDLLSAKQLRLNNLRATIENPHSSKKEIEQAKEDYQKEMPEFLKLVKQMIADNKASFAKMMEEKGYKGMTIDSYRLARYKWVGNSQTAKGLTAYEDKLRDYDEQMSNIDASTSNAKVEAERIKGEKEFYMASNMLYDWASGFKATFGTEEQTKGIDEILSQLLSLEQFMYSQIGEYRSVFDMANSELATTTTPTGGGTGGTTATEKELNIVKGSLKETENQLKSLHDELNSLIIDYEIYQGKKDNPRLLELIEEEKRLKKILILQKAYINILKEGMNLSADNSTKSKYATLKDADSFMSKNLTPFGETSGDWSNGAVDGINSLTGAMMALNGVMNESGAQWMNFVTTFASGVAQMIPMVVKLIAMNTAQQTSSQGVVAGNAAKDASSIPFGWIAIPAIIATVIGMFSAIPKPKKFAQGGIFSTMGDMNLARVNRGEMILNNAQQQHLWNLINGNQNGTYSNNLNSVKFEINGKQLVGVLNNYNNKRNRVL